MNRSIIVNESAQTDIRVTRVVKRNNGRNKVLVIITLSIAVLIALSCNSGQPKNINTNGNTIRERIKAPNNYTWIEEERESFGAFLQNIVVERAGSKILDYKGTPIYNQSEHVAILNYDIGKKDLQQCADAVIRIRAEYLFSKKRFNEIGFHFTNGMFFTWNEYKSGYRPKLQSNGKIICNQEEAYDDSYTNFRKYLDIIYMYAGTISLNAETKKVTNDKFIQAGDILITPGSPGHAVIIVGRANSKNGETVYLIAEGYTPAQSIHIITNSNNEKINPWYTLSINDAFTITARYTFTKTNIRTFSEE